MSMKLASAQLAELATVVEAPRVPHTADRTFGLPGRLYGVTFGAYLAFVGLMAMTFMTGDLAIPMTVIFLFIVMAIAVPGMWTGIGPEGSGRRTSWSSMTSHGLMTHDGHVSAGAAAVQVLVLPIAILVWGIIIAVIAALI